MKAVTVAGGPSDDPKIEAETTVSEGEPEARAESGAGVGTAGADRAEPGATADAVAVEPSADAESRPVAEGATDADLPSEARPETDAAPEAGAEADADGEPEAAAAAAAAADTGAEIGAKAGAEPETGAGTGAGAEVEAEADAGAGTGAETETGAEAKAGARAEVEAEAGADAGANAGAEAGTGTGAETGVEVEADAEAGAEAGPDANAGADAGTGTETGAGTGTEVEAGAGAGAETGAEVEADAGADAEAGTDANAGADAEVGTGTGAEAGAKTGAGAVPQAAADLAREAEPDLAGRPERAAQREGEAVPQAAPASEPEPAPAGEADAEANAVPETDAKGTAPSQGDDEPVAEAPAEDEPEAAAETQDEDDAELPGEADSEAGTAPEPQAPGREASGAEAEAVVEAPSDQTMLITPPKPKPKPDTPGPDTPRADPRTAGEAPSDRTMLIARPKEKATEPDAPRKAPSWARKAEPAADADPERTSQFVALKDVDLPAPVAPRAQPRPSEARVAAPAPAAPLPPLDLLADLTNTPPPAETPRRTVVRRVKIWTPILLLVVGAGVGAQLLRPLPTPQLVASKTDGAIAGEFSIPWPAEGQGAVRVSGSGDLGTFGEQKPVPTASVAKVMTAYVILKGHPLRKSDPGPDITVDAKAVADGGSEHESRIRSLTVGQKFSQQDMLKMLMIPSGNNIGRLLARWDSGTDSEAAFVAKMNAAAKELGMDNTTYTDPSGLDSATVSTAEDQLKLAEAVMKDEVFRTIVALPNATIKGLPERLENNNILLNSQGLSIRGIKTGSSTPAGGTLMWAAYKSIGDETPLVLGTLMDQHADGPDVDGADSLKLVLANSKKIIEAVRNALAAAPVIRKGDVVGHLDDGLGGRTPLMATKDLNVIGVPGQRLELSLTAPAGAGPLPHTAKAGTEVAVLTVGDGESAKKVPVAVKGALAEPSFGTRLTRGR
ncbi:D-alanyl-D-alanine carboxypeptidase [Streptomyces sp. NPDC092307]|uniref:D-alanyl-D-alanine carboxypeptidase n=1 Tax=Streptomyces sp. NPDC092307 TaxID=3366013 RepID=UPI00380D1B90